MQREGEEKKRRKDERREDEEEEGEGETQEADTDRGSRLLLGNTGRSGESRKRGDSVTKSQPGRSAHHLGMLIKIVLMSVSNQMALSRAFFEKNFSACLRILWYSLV